MPHVRYSKAELSRLIAHTIICQQRGRLRQGVLTAVFLGISDSLIGKHKRLWATLAEHRVALWVFHNGKIPLDPPA